MPYCKKCQNTRITAVGIHPYIFAMIYECEDCGHKSIWFYWE